MTLALYRRYRPDTFDDVIGQEHVTDLLRTSLDSGRISHAYLFSGPRGCGKTTSARIMARCLNCEQGPTSTPCGTCDSCLELASGGPGSLDVVEIDAASHNGVDDARELRERAEFAPTRDRFKIFILDEAHMVTAAGFNALLKLVEEPPPHVKFIFATTEPEKVIGTIRSRTHHYPFRLVAPGTLQPYLEQLCAKEGIPVQDGVLPLVIRAGGGSVRDSLSVLDQLIAGTGEAGLTYAGAIDLLGFTDSSLLDKMMDALGVGDGAAVFQVASEIAESGHDPRRFAEDLLQRVRDVLICALAPEQASEILPQVPADQLERMLAQSQVWGSRMLSRRADLIDEALRTMGGATSPRLQLELLIGRLLLVGSGDPQVAATPAVSAAPAAPATPAKAEAPVAEVTPTAPTPVAVPKSAPVEGISLDSVKARWDDVIAAVGTPSVGARLRYAQPADLEGQVINLAAGGAAAGFFAAGTPAFDMLQSAVQQVFGAGWSAVIGGAASATAPQTQAPTPAAAPSPRPRSQAEPQPQAESQPAVTASTGWGVVAIPGSGDDDGSAVTEDPKVPAEAPVRPASSAPKPVAVVEPTPEPDPIPEPMPEPDYPPDSEPEPDTDWGYGASMDDQTVKSPPNRGLDLLLSVLGGTVIEEIEEEA